MATLPGAAPEVQIRRARPEDAAASQLVFTSAPGEFTRLAGSSQMARAALRRAWPVPGHSMSFEFAWVAECGGRIVGVAIVFPARERYRRHAALLLRSLRWLPRTRWAVLPLALPRLAASTASPPRDALYVAALAILPSHHRRGIATSFGPAVEAQARAQGLSRLACHTGAGRLAARQALANFGLRPAVERGGYVLYTKKVV
jgi:GNAT superfamily N-acetyltransferase